MESPRAQGTLLERLGVLVESRVVRSGLVVLIILSVLPYSGVERALRWVFLGAFGAELLIRVPLLLQRRRKGTASLGSLAFLVIDVAAFLSFLPLEEWFHQHFEWLVFMRLTRLVVVLRFARELAADLYSILTRREQLQQFGLVTGAVAALAFVSAVILSQLGIEHDYDGTARPAEGFWDEMWWSFRQLESADNLVANLHVHPVVGVLSLVLTITGVFIISFIIGIGTNVVEQVVKAERRRNVGYSGHTIVIGPIGQSEILIREFVRIYSKNRRDFRDQLAKLWRWLARGAEAPRAWQLPRMALLGPSADPPAVLLEPGMRWVVYRQGDAADTEDLARIGAARAKRAILLGDPLAGEDSDAITVATLAALRELNPHAHVYVELLSSRNFSTLHALGEGARTFPLDVQWILGLFILHHLVIPGVERLYQILLTADGSELYSHVYLQDAELDDLEQAGDEDGLIDARVLAQLAERRGVILIGVLLGDVRPDLGAHDLVSIDGLRPWVNPFAAPRDSRLEALGARPGKIPANRLRGLIAVGETYQPVRDYARAVAGMDDTVAARPRAAGLSFDAPAKPPRCVVLVGLTESVASLSARLDQLVGDASVIVAAHANTPRLAAFASAMDAAGIHLERSGKVWRAELASGGHLEVRSPRHGNAMDAAIAALHEEPVEAVVFLVETGAKDPDARTGLRLMRLAEHLLAEPDGGAPHVLLEVLSLAKGERVRREVERAFRRARREPPRVTLVSSEQLRNYFMVHSAFVPAISDVYGNLLGGRGHDLVRLPMRGGRPVTQAAASAHLAERGLLALALERATGEVVLNPPAQQAFDDVTAIFAIGDPEHAPSLRDEEE